MTDLAHTTAPAGVAVRAADTRELVRGSAWLLSSVVIGALTSAVFWLIAARLYSSTDVGRSSGLFTSVLFVCFATGLGLPVAISRFVHPPGRQPASLFSWALVLSGVASALGALLYLALVSSPSAATLQRHGWLGFLIFTATTSGSSLSLLVDVRLMAARRWAGMFARVAMVGVLQLVLLGLGAPAGAPDLWLFLAAAAPTALSGFAGVAALPFILGEGYRLRPKPDDATAIARFASANYVATLALEAPRFVLPVIVLVNVPASDNANFYIAWAVVAVALMVPGTLGQALLVEGSRDGRVPPQSLRTIVVIGGALMALAWVAAVLLRDVVPLLYGAEYRNAGQLLPILLAAGVPWVLTSVALADARVRQDQGATLCIALGLSAGVLVPAALLVPRYGLAGAGGPWLAGNVIAALVGLLVLRTRHRPDAVPLSFSARVGPRN